MWAVTQVNRRPSAICSFLAAAICCCQISLSAAAEGDQPLVRTWTDRTGVYTIDASLVDCQDGTARLQRTDGMEISVELKLLHATDRSYVRDEMRQRTRAQRLAKSQATPVTRVSRDVGTASSIDSDSDSERLYGIDWYPTTESALTVASSGSDAKPVYWFRVLGDLNGFM